MNAKVRITYRDKDNNEILNPTDGEKAYSPETKKLYQWSADAGEWKLIDGDINLGMTTYDLNKQIIGQMDVLDAEGLTAAANTLTTYAKASDNIYHMLLCRDINYYTIFKIDILNEEVEGFGEVVLDCATDIGAIKSVDNTEDGAIEIWVHPVDNEPVVMYLFPYDAGVVECTL
jgi:hypothetical protein